MSMKKESKVSRNGGPENLERDVPMKHSVAFKVDQENNLLTVSLTDGETVGEEKLSQTGTPSLAPAQVLWTSIREQPVKLRMTDSGPGSEPPLTISQMFQETVAAYGDVAALVSKHDGKWVTLTYREYYQQCRVAAKSFLKLGLERFHGVGILGFNSPEWFIAAVGCIMAGGLGVGIYTTNSAEASHYVASNCKANVLVVENDRQLQKILEVRDKLPHLKAIVQYKDELTKKIPNLYTWKGFLALGAGQPDYNLDKIMLNQKANECCTLIYTSGTTGNPKGVMLSHDNITWTSYIAGLMTKLEKGKEAIVSYLPLSHVAAQLYDMWITMRFAGTTYFADPDVLKGTLVDTLRDVRPTRFLGVPRVWEKMQEKMKSVGASNSSIRKLIASWAKGIGLHAGYNVMHGNSSVPWGFMLANNLVFKRVRQALGLDRCLSCFTGAAPITKDTLEYFLSLGIPVYELYGMSESTGPHTISDKDGFRITSCGKVLLGGKTMLDKPDADGIGEVCFWGRHVFMGYLDMKAWTEEALDKDGWLHSGDLGKEDENGFLYITGRIKELIITAGGENVPPVPIEDRVKQEIPIISNAMLIGDQLRFLSILLTLKNVMDDEGNPTDKLTPEVVDFCRRLGMVATLITDITSKEDTPVHKAIQKGIDYVNDMAPSNAQKIQKWTILEQDFSVSTGELGPTMKLKRPVVMRLYKEEIDKFYV